MGGSVTMIIKKDNKIKKMCRWTNALSSFFNNKKFLFQDDFYIKQYIKTYEQMEKDYERNKKDKNFEYDMSDVYVPNGGVFAPVAYGIVYVDFDNKEIYSCQGYTKIFSIHLAFIKQDKEDDKKHFDEYEDLFKNGFLKIGECRVPEYKKVYDDFEKLFSKSKSLSNFLEKIENDRNSHFLSFEINYKKFFKVIEFRDNKESFKKLFNIFKEKELLNKDDIKIWKKFIKDQGD